MALSNILNATGAKKKIKNLFTEADYKKKYIYRFWRYKYSGKHLEVGVVLHIYIYTVDLQ